MYSIYKLAYVNPSNRYRLGKAYSIEDVVRLLAKTKQIQLDNNGVTVLVEARDETIEFIYTIHRRRVRIIDGIYVLERLLQTYRLVEEDPTISTLAPDIQRKIYAGNTNLSQRINTTTSQVAKPLLLEQCKDPITVAEIELYLKNNPSTTVYMAVRNSFTSGVGMLGNNYKGKVVGMILNISSGVGTYIYLSMSTNLRYFSKVYLNLYDAYTIYNARKSCIDLDVDYAKKMVLKEYHLIEASLAAIFTNKDSIVEDVIWGICLIGLLMPKGTGDRKTVEDELKLFHNVNITQLYDNVVLGLNTTTLSGYKDWSMEWLHSFKQYIDTL